MAPIRAVAEENDVGVVLFAFAYPGACGWGPSEVDARTRLQDDVSITVGWLEAHGLDHRVPSLEGAHIDIEITERVPATGDPLQCDSEGFFEFDRQSYSDADVAGTRALLEASRQDLLDLVADLSPPGLDHRLVADRRTAREVIDHVAIAEHWYLTRVEVPVDIAADWRDSPGDTFERLAETRADVMRALESLPNVPDVHRERSWVVDGERWSLRKVLRRLVWHERLHFKQLTRLVPKLEAATT